MVFAAEEEVNVETGTSDDNCSLIDDVTCSADFEDASFAGKATVIALFVEFSATG